MSEDAPVNTGAVQWPDPASAYYAVRRMQTKLHRWAGEDSSRRFGDLHVRHEAPLDRVAVKDRYRWAVAAA